MSFDQDVIKIRDIIENDIVFKAATPEQISNRVDKAHQELLKKFAPGTRIRYKSKPFSGHAGNKILSKPLYLYGKVLYTRETPFSNTDIATQVYVNFDGHNKKRYVMEPWELEVVNEANQPIFKAATPSNLNAREEQKEAELEKKWGKVWKVADANDEFSFGPGNYYLGDICYALDDDIYDEIWGKKFLYSEGVYGVMGHIFAVAPTYYGDGNYKGSDGKYYGVDAGVIGIVPKELSKEQRGELTGGQWIKVKRSLIFYAHEGVFEIDYDGKNITINTRGADESVNEDNDPIFKAATKKQINNRPKIFTQSEIGYLWGSPNPLTYKGKEYYVKKTSSGKYFMEPINWRGGERDGFSAGTLWFERTSPDQYIVIDEANDPVFKAASPTNLANRSAEFEKNKAERVKRLSGMNKILDTEPENADASVAMFFDDFNSEEDISRNDMFVTFVREMEREFLIDLSDLEKRYINVKEEDRDEVEFCNQAAERIAAEGLFVYNGEEVFEVYTSADLENAIITEANDPTFKPATPENLKARGERPATIEEIEYFINDAYSDVTAKDLDLNNSEIEILKKTEQEIEFGISGGHGSGDYARMWIVDYDPSEKIIKLEYEFGNDMDRWNESGEAKFDRNTRKIIYESVNESKPIFKAATKEQLRARKSRPANIPPAGGFEYKFLEYIEDPTENKSWKLVGMGLLIDMENSEIWFSGDGDPEINFYVDTNEAILQNLTRDATLTKECQDYFEKSGYEGFVSKIEGWVKSKGWYSNGSGNTYNEDNAYFLGSIFEYTKFTDSDDRMREGNEGIIIMTHNGGDVRGNYSYPTVYYGDVEEFMNTQYFGDPHDDIAYHFGYKEYDDLIYDIKKYRGTLSAGENRPHERETPGQMRWTLDRENPAETYTEAKI